MKYVPHGREDRYDGRTLRGLAAEWEYPLVMETEEQFSKIRRAIRAVREFERSLGRMDEAIKEVEFMAAREMGLRDLDEDLMEGEFRLTGFGLAGNGGDSEQGE